MLRAGHSHTNCAIKLTGLRPTIAVLGFTVVAVFFPNGAAAQTQPGEGFPTGTGGYQKKPIALGSVRAVAGESRSVGWESATPTIESVLVNWSKPPLPFPIRVEVVEQAGTHSLRAIIPPATPAGEYDLDVTATSSGGEAVRATLHVTVDAVTVSPPAAANFVPVILLNGWQICTFTGPDSTLAASTATFGQLASFLQADGASVLFFNNCAYGDIKIEQLATQLNSYLANLRYTDGTPVAQVDLVTHSMSGLIARAYLAGLQTDGSASPSLNTRIRKLIEIATPNFGSFVAANFSVFTGIQSSEMIPGSTFLWYLATWNQRGDDLRGVDALAVIGDAGTYGNAANASDGVVSLTSASLGFVAADQRTRIVHYCHTDPPSFGMSCSAARGIANVTDASQDTGRIVRSFLAGTADWLAIGVTPSQNTYLSRYGGIYFELENATWQYLNDLTQVTFGTVPLQNGGATGRVFYNEFFVGGTDTFHATSASLGQITYGVSIQAAGHYTAIRAKFSPAIYFVSPVLPNTTARIVQSGTTITLNGIGFGQRCSVCQVSASGLPLQISSWNDQTISAFLPTTYNGIVQLVVQTASGKDAINIMAAVPVPVITVSPPNLQFTYTIGGAISPGQSVQVGISTAGIGWSASASASWLSVTPAFSPTPSTFTVSVSPAGLATGTYNGNITVSALGAASQTVAVTLTVSAPAAPNPIISSIVNAASFLTGMVPGSLATLFGNNLSPVTGIELPGAAISYKGVTVTVQSIQVPLLAMANVNGQQQINFQIPFQLPSASTAHVVVNNNGSVGAFDVPVLAAQPGIFEYIPAGSSANYGAVLKVDGSTVGPNNPASRGDIVSVYVTGMGATSPAMQTGQFGPSNPPAITVLQPSVSVGGVGAQVLFSGYAPGFLGLYQINFVVPSAAPVGNAVNLNITVGTAASQTSHIAVQ